MGIEKKYINHLELVTTTIQIHKVQQSTLIEIIKTELEKGNSVSISELHRAALDLFIADYVSKGKKL